MNREIDTKIIDSIFSEYEYPKEFLAEYDQMECLASHKGRETFLVKEKESGSYAIAKCYDTSVFDISSNEVITMDYDFKGLPRFIKEYRAESCVCIVREYVKGESVSKLLGEQKMTQRQIIDICVKLSDILIFLHHQDTPVIHRDIKPENIIITPENEVYLIDFDIARTVNPDAESDTLFFGTRGYAPPEQYGFSQTDAKADIYSFGVLLRFMMTGSIKANSNIRIYSPLQKIIDKCTAFSPEKRYADMKNVKRDLLLANPKAQAFRVGRIVTAIVLACAVLTFGGIKLYQYITYSPFTADHIPAYISDEERIVDAVAYMKEKYDTDIFDESENFATVGDLRKVLMEVYGLDHDYVYGFAPDIPQESEDYFMPWGWPDSNYLDRDIVVYAAVKVHDPSIVSDFSKLKDDNGFYPGVRLAVMFAEDTGMLTGANRPGDISIGEMALIFANAEKVFKQQSE